MYRLETERLTITEFTADMAQAVHENSLDRDVRRFVPDEVFETVEEAADTVAFLMGQYGRNGGPLVYPVLRREDGANIGYVQAVPMEDGEWEIGYHIGEKYTRRGYAAEAVTAFLPDVMRRLGINRISGVCMAENAASRRVMEKCGFRLIYEGLGDYQGVRTSVCRYEFEERKMEK